MANTPPKGYDPREVAAAKRRRLAATGEWVYRREDVLSSLDANRPIIRDPGSGEPLVDAESGKVLRGYNPAFDSQGRLVSANTLPNPKNFDIKNLTEDSYANVQSPVDGTNIYRLPSELTEIPTSSTNASRPRTLAAGWRPYQETQAVLDRDRRLGTLTVMFRDGTLYNYYDVPYSLWSTFKGSLSKGPYVNYKNKNQGSDGPLLAYPRGPANITDVPESVRDDIQTLARAAQLSFSTTNRGRGGYLAPDKRKKKPGTPIARPYVPKKASKASGLSPYSKAGRNPNATKGRRQAR